MRLYGHCGTEQLGKRMWTKHVNIFVCVPVSFTEGEPVCVSGSIRSNVEWTFWGNGELSEAAVANIRRGQPFGFVCLDPNLRPNLLSSRRYVGYLQLFRQLPQRSRVVFVVEPSFYVWSIPPTPATGALSPRTPSPIESLQGKILVALKDRA